MKSLLRVRKTKDDNILQIWPLEVLTISSNYNDQASHSSLEFMQEFFFYHKIQRALKPSLSEERDKSGYNSGRRLVIHSVNVSLYFLRRSSHLVDFILLG